MRFYSYQIEINGQIIPLYISTWIIILFISLTKGYSILNQKAD